MSTPAPTTIADSVPPTEVSFADLGVPEWMVSALSAQGVTAPFPIQASTIPDALAGRDVCGRAPTGSGKTIAFGIPLVLRTERAEPRRPAALVLAPTRELAAQIAEELDLLGHRQLRVAVCYGGVGFGAQINALRRGVDVLVACPGRLADLLNQGELRLDDVSLVVIDEADRMADMGFLPEVKRLLDKCRSDRQTLLFSATLDGDVDVLIKRYQNNPVRHEHKRAHDDVDTAEHHFWLVDRAQRIDVTASVVQRVGPTVVFSRTKHGADRIARQLGTKGVRAVAIHGGRSQGQRDRALDTFRRGEAEAIVATDVAARGIHVDDVACVVHFDPPGESKDYVHRSGRTGRAGADGTVVTLVHREVRKDVIKSQRELGRKIDLIDPTVGDLPAGDPRPVTAPSKSRHSGQRDEGNRGGGKSRNGRGRNSGGGGGGSRNGGSNRRSGDNRGPGASRGSGKGRGPRNGAGNAGGGGGGGGARSQRQGNKRPAGAQRSA